MQRIDIWLSGATSGEERLAGLLRALDEAGVVTQLRALPDRPAKRAPFGLIWQQKDDALDRALAIAAGAADIIGPWMHPAETLARCLRHARAGDAPPGATGSQLQLGELEIDLIEREAWRQGRTLGLLQREFELLHFLARCPDWPHSREALLRAIWRLRFDPGTNVVEVHVSRLRAKLDRGYAWQMLRTIKGGGYALVTAGNAY